MRRKTGLNREREASGWQREHQHHSANEYKLIMCNLCILNLTPSSRSEICVLKSWRDRGVELVKPSSFPVFAWWKHNHMCVCMWVRVCMYRCVYVSIFHLWICLVASFRRNLLSTVQSYTQIRTAHFTKIRFIIGLVRRYGRVHNICNVLDVNRCEFYTWNMRLIRSSIMNPCLSSRFKLFWIQIMKPGSSDVAQRKIFSEICMEFNTLKPEAHPLQLTARYLRLGWFDMWAKKNNNDDDNSLSIIIIITNQQKPVQKIISQ